MEMRLQSQPHHPASISPPPFAPHHLRVSPCDSVEALFIRSVSRSFSDKLLKKPHLREPTYSGYLAHPSDRYPAYPSDGHPAVPFDMLRGSGGFG